MLCVNLLNLYVMRKLIKFICPIGHEEDRLVNIDITNDCWPLSQEVERCTMKPQNPNPEYISDFIKSEVKMPPVSSVFKSEAEIPAEMSLWQVHRCDLAPVAKACEIHIIDTLRTFSGWIIRDMYSGGCSHGLRRSDAEHIVALHNASISLSDTSENSTDKEAEEVDPLFNLEIDTLKKLLHRIASYTTAVDDVSALVKAFLDLKENVYES